MEGQAAYIGVAEEDNTAVLEVARLMVTEQIPTDPAVAVGAVVSSIVAVGERIVPAEEASTAVVVVVVVAEPGHTPQEPAGSVLHTVAVSEDFLLAFGVAVVCIREAGSVPVLLIEASHGPV